MSCGIRGVEVRRLLEDLGEMFAEGRVAEGELVCDRSKDAIDVASIAVPRTEEARTKEPVLFPPVRNSESDRRLPGTSKGVKPKNRSIR